MVLLNLWQTLAIHQSVSSLFNMLILDLDNKDILNDIFILTLYLDNDYHNNIIIIIIYHNCYYRHLYSENSYFNIPCPWDSTCSIDEVQRTSGLVRSRESQLTRTLILYLLLICSQSFIVNVRRGHAQWGSSQILFFSWRGVLCRLTPT